MCRYVMDEKPGLLLTDLYEQAEEEHRKQAFER